MKQDFSRPVKYDLDYAISLRGQTFAEAGMFSAEDMAPGQEAEIIDFYLSIQIADDEALNGWTPPSWWEIIAHKAKDQHDRTITRDGWYSALHYYRQWHRECNLSHQYADRNNL